MKKFYIAIFITLLLFLFIILYLISLFTPKKTIVENLQITPKLVEEYDYGSSRKITPNLTQTALSGIPLQTSIAPTNQTIQPSSTAQTNPSQSGQNNNQSNLQDLLKQVSVLSNEDLKKLEVLKNNLPYETADFAVGYSPLLNKFVITKKTNQADAKIQAWAKENSLTELITKGDLFSTTDQIITDYINKTENNYQANQDKIIAIEQKTIDAQTPGFMLTPYINPPTVNTNGTGQSLNDVFNTVADIFKTIFNEETLKDFQITPSPSAGSTGGSDSSFNISSSLIEILSEVAQKVGVPQRILEAVMKIESPATTALSSSEIAAYSAPGAIIPGCGPNLCSAAGPMQMTIGFDNNGDTSCPSCGTGFCPNAWSSYGRAVNTYGGYSHTPNPCNIKDNVYAAALKLKRDSGANNPDAWTQDQVYRAATSYYGSCSDKYRYPRLGNRTYCEYVWWYYQTPTSSEASGGGNPNVIYYCQGNTEWKDNCSLGSAGCGVSSMAVILSSFGVMMNPPQVDAVFQQNGWRSCGDYGSSMYAVINSSWLKNLGFTVGPDLASSGTLNIKESKKYIDNGYILLASSRAYPCANCKSAGATIDHVIVVDGVDETAGTVNVRDTNNCSYTDGNDERSTNRVKNVNDFPWLYAFPIKKL